VVNMESRRVRTIVGLGVAVLLFVGFGVGRLFGGVNPFADGGAAPTCEDPLPWDRAHQVVGEPAAIAGPVVAASHQPDVGGGPTFLNLGNPHPEEPRFDIVIYEDVRERFDAPPERAFESTDVCVQGQVRDRDGVPQIVLDGPAFLEPR
jgi:hypothetical protein